MIVKAAAPDLLKACELALFAVTTDADINGGNLVFSPAANGNGAAYASFTFQVEDDGGTANGGVDLDTSARTMTVNVTSVNDAPVGTNNTVTTLEDTAITFNAITGVGGGSAESQRCPSWSWTMRGVMNTSSSVLASDRRLLRNKTPTPGKSPKNSIPIRLSCLVLMPMVNQH